MKKIFALVILLVVMLTSCGGDVTILSGGKDDDVYREKTSLELLEMMRETVEGESLSVYIDPFDLSDRDAFTYHFFIEYDANIKEGAICQPMNGVIPFFLGILKVSSEKEAKVISKKIEENINYRKLVCTSFEKAHVVVKGSVVFLALDGDASRCDRMLSCFEALG